MGAFSHIKCAATSDVGRKRKNNEDSFGVFPESGFFCVADGMGGGDDGEVASAATVRAIEDFTTAHPQPENAGYSAERYADGICKALVETSSWIFDRTQEKHLKGCGSTFVGICFDPTRPSEALALHAGDSRIYRIRGRSIQRITRDHSAAELIGAKDEDDVNPMFRGMILRAVGIQPIVEVERTPVQVKVGDKFVICSDGLYRMVPEKKIVSILRAAETPDAAVKSLIEAANEAGGVDNVTAVLVEVGELPKPLPVAELKIETSEESTCDTVMPESKTCETGDPITRDTDAGSGAIFGEIGACKSDGGESPGKGESSEEEPAPSLWTRIRTWFSSRKKG